jgi:hypothetical protein
MQNRYVGDIGDFVKFGLLRALGQGDRLGIAWYLCPDETHNRDGKHVDYLEDFDRWRHLDPPLFDGLRDIVRRGERSVGRVKASGLLPNAAFSATPLDFKGMPHRKAWFRGVLADLRECSIVFADPDNGLCEDDDRWVVRGAWKRMPLSEALEMAAGRPAVIYHHNNRSPGGHTAQIQHWLRRLKTCGADALALYWRKYSQRTFFVVRPSREIEERLCTFERKWAKILCRNGLPICELHTLGAMTEQESGTGRAKSKLKGAAQSAPKKCPECPHVFRGNGWDGIDAHWKAHHENIMPYSEAWPIIKSGRRPSGGPL